MYSTLLLECRDAIATITLNRPDKRNAVTTAMIADLQTALDAIEKNHTTRVVILTGAGKAFCAGMDLKEFVADKSTTGAGRPTLDIFTRQFYPKPVIAAINGTAVAGGFELMLACDLVIAADHAMFGIAEVKRGLVAKGGGTRLPRRIPLAIALEMGLTGDLISATRAYELGLINTVVSKERLLGEALALAARVAANAPLALSVTKQLMREEIGAAEWEHINAAAAPVFASDDAREGAAAFAEKRPPRWKGS